MALKWYQDDYGDTSFMRIGAMVAICLGGLIILTGLFVAIYEEIKQAKIVDGVALTGIGVGLITAALGFKALQRGAEARIANGETK